MKTERELKVYNMSGYQYKDTPTIMLKGNWLKEFGFDAGQEFKVVCENERLVILAKEKDPEPVKATSHKRTRC